MGKFLGSAAADAYYGATSPMGGNDIHTALPRNKFNYGVLFRFYDSTPTLELKTVANIDLPTANFKTQTVNQYNKKRIVHTGYELPDVSMTMYDTKDGVLDKFLAGYANHYFGGIYNQSESDMSPADIISDRFNDSSHSGKGFKLQTQKYYIKELVIVRTGDSASDKREWVIENPTIVSIAPDTLDYSSSEAMQYRLGFAYEGFYVNDPNSLANNSVESNSDLQLPAGQTLPDLVTRNPFDLSPNLKRIVDNAPRGLSAPELFKNIGTQAKNLSMSEVGQMSKRYFGK